jgi:phosphonate transport system substrate-binding protein
MSVVSIVSPRDTFQSYSELVKALGVKLGREVELVQRRTYREVNDLLIAGQLDVVFLCTGGWLELRERAPNAAAIVAMPQSAGKTTYESLIIVPAASSAMTLDDLAGKRFAFTDELSLSGREYVVELLRRSGRRADDFFESTLYTHSHDRSITAVAKGLVHGAAVHSTVLAQMSATQPLLTERVRVIHRSAEFGASPVVVSTRLPDELRARVRDALLSLEADAEGASALRMLQIDRFVVPPPGAFDSAERLREAR